MNKKIEFYKAHEPYGYLSNFARYPVTIDGSAWPTSEHYYQAMKFTDPKIRQTIRRTAGPAEAKRIGGTRGLPLRHDWISARDGIMHKVVRAKFMQHPMLLRLLLRTGDKELVEHTENDRYWGDGGDGSGKNMLGKILMQVREELKPKEEKEE